MDRRHEDRARTDVVQGVHDPVGLVAPDHRRTGLGRRLLGFAEAQAPDGATVATLFTGERSDRNIALYQKSGYVLTDDPAPAGAVRLSKPLAG